MQNIGAFRLLLENFYGFKTAVDEFRNGTTPQRAFVLNRTVEDAWFVRGLYLAHTADGVDATGFTVAPQG